MPKLPTLPTRLLLYAYVLLKFRVTNSSNLKKMQCVFFSFFFYDGSCLGVYFLNNCLAPRKLETGSFSFVREVRNFLRKSRLVLSKSRLKCISQYGYPIGTYYLFLFKILKLNPPGAAPDDVENLNPFEKCSPLK